MKIVPLPTTELPSATALLVASYPYDRLDVVAGEKLFGENGARRGSVLGAYDGDGVLCGVVAFAGRWIKVLGVPPSRRRRGIGSALLAAVEAAVGQPLRIADHPGNYLTPGVDVRDESAAAFLRARGFRQTGEVENLRAPIAGNALIDRARHASLVHAAEIAGYACRRATPEELPSLTAWIAGAFASVWALEAERARRGPCAALHVAAPIADPHAYVAFAAADGNNQGLGWFGPAGTDPAHRGKKLGETLLLACLLDVAALPEAGVIAWIGPKPFYARAVGAVDDRRFSQWDQKEPTS